jgi:hypothetical protein
VLYEKGGTIIYVHDSLQYTNIVLSAYCKEKDIEICAVKLFMNSLNILIITIYRAPSGNFKYFLQQLHNILQAFSTLASHTIICGDLNINYLTKNSQRRQLENLLRIYNPKSSVNFPTRTSNSSVSNLDNSFIEVSRYEDFSVTPFENGMSDHEAQTLTINIPAQRQFPKPKFIRKMDKFAILDFIFKLSINPGRVFLIIMM